MTNRSAALIFCFALILCLCACGKPAPGPEETVPDTSQPTDSATMAEAGSPEVFRQPDAIFVYPYTEDELAQALEAARESARELGADEGTLTFEAERLAFDPILTDIHARQRLRNAPVEGWQEADYYSHYLSFTLIYSATYDHALSPRSDKDHAAISMELYRQSPEDPWVFLDSGEPTSEYSSWILDAAELEKLPMDTGRILAAYQPGENQRWLYVLAEDSGEVRYLIQNID